MKLDRHLPRRKSAASATHANGPRSDEGAVAVEFALIVVPLLAICFGIISFGVVFTQMQGLSNAARDAARAGVVSSGSDPTSCTDLVNQVATDVDVLPGMSADAVTVEVSRGGAILCSTSILSEDEPCIDSPVAGAESRLRVEVSHESSLELIVAKPSVTLSQSGVFRCEYS